MSSRARDQIVEIQKAYELARGAVLDLEHKCALFFDESTLHQKAAHAALALIEVRLQIEAWSQALAESSK